MNIIKGLDRIALVIAILAILPGFYVGALFYHEAYEKPNPKYSPPGPGFHLPGFRIPSQTREPSHIYPPWYDHIFPGLVGAGIGFVVCLYGIRLGTRGVKHFSLWIRDGFREDTIRKRDR